jgi:iron complex outermembrane receptor protein
LALLGATGLASVLIPLGAHAAVADTGDSTAHQSSATVDTVIVTARRREENLQTVPVSVTVVSQQKLDANNIQTLGDLQYLVPSLSASTQFTRDAVNLSVRGIGTNGLAGLPGVVVYLDEVPVPTTPQGEAGGGPGLLFDLGAVQVLKGPQGTLFGRNTTGGALLLNSAKPADNLSGSVEGGIGNYNDRQYDAQLNIPLFSDKLVARLSLNGEKRDGFTHVLSDASHPNGFDADARDYNSVRASLSFRPSERFQNDFRITYLSYDSHGTPLLLTALDPSQLLPTFFPALVTYFNEQQALGPRTAVGSDIPLVASGNSTLVSNVTSVDLSDQIKFRNILGYDNVTGRLTIDGDGTPLPILDAISAPETDVTHQFTEEAQLVGKTSNLDWVLGAFYLRSKSPHFIRQDQTFFFGNGTNFFLPSSTSKALYGQGTYDLSDLVPNLRLTAGLRYTQDDRAQINETAAAPAPVTTKSRSEALTYNLSVDYTVTPGTMVYVTTRRGYRAGGFNSPGVTPEEFKPEFVTDYEAGVKSDWSLGTIPVRADLALYRTSYDDVQVQANLIQPNGTFTLVTTNAATARIWGVEFEAAAKLTPDLQVGVNMDYLNFDYTSFGPGVDPATLVGGTTNGGRIPFKWGVNARYRLPLPDSIGDVSIQANYNWQAHYGDFTIPGAGIDSFGLLNATVDWDRVLGSSADLQIFGSNLTNELYNIGPLALTNTAFGYSVGRYGEPRMYGVRLRYRFGER